MNKQELIARNQDLERTVLQQQDQINQLQRMIFGSKSERRRKSTSDENQTSLFDQLSEQESNDSQTAKVAVKTQPRTKQKPRSIFETLTHLEEQRIEQQPDLANQEDYLYIGKKEVKSLGYKPGTFYIETQIVHSYKHKLDGHIVSGQAPLHPIPKCEASIDLLQHIAVSKFVDHLPEYRQLKIMKRAGVRIAPSTMNGWMHKIAELLKPMGAYLEKQILNSGYLMMDESTIKVMQGKKNRTHTGYMWVIYSPLTHLVRFIYHPSREHRIPAKLLDNFSGAFQSDGYQAYHSIADARTDLVHLCCHAHSRRKFENALTNDPQKANFALDIYRQLYQIERDCRDYKKTNPELQNHQFFDYRKKVRQKLAIPILDTFKNWIEQQAQCLTPSSLIAKAVSYTINRYKELSRYVDDGKYEIDNNLIENCIRPLALGRKNYLFAGNHNSAENIANFYSVFESCRHLGILPGDYLKWYLENIGNIKVNQIQKLSPLNFLKTIQN